MSTCISCGCVVPSRRQGTRYCSLSCERKDLSRNKKLNKGYDMPNQETRLCNDDLAPFRTQTTCGYVHEIDPNLGF